MGGLLHSALHGAVSNDCLYIMCDAYCLRVSLSTVPIDIQVSGPLGFKKFMINFALVILMMLNRSAILGRSFEISESIGF